MLGVSGMMGSAGDGAASAEPTQTHDGETGVLGEEEKLVMRIDEAGGDRSSGGGNRWPRQETVALLKIRSEMDAVFKDSSLKGPLWEEVSRKLAEMGFHRNAKKCKEKFENVFKYHKRTKEGRASKPESKTYRFFDQLEALETHPPVTGQSPSTTLNHLRPTMLPVPATKVNNNNNIVIPTQVSNSSTSTVPSSLSPINVSPINAVTTMAAAAASAAAAGMGNFGSVSTSSSTSSDEDIERRSRKKRKWEMFFQRLMKDVMEKQENMQKKFLETLEKRERDRVSREEAWRVMEIARLNREHEILVQERSTAAAKDAAVIAFLQKVSDQQSPPIPNSTPIQIPPQTQTQPPPPPQPQPQETVRSLPPVLPQLTQPPPPPAPPQPPTLSIALEIPNSENGVENFTPASSSRWPKAEVQALIGLRTNMDLKYQDNGPKGPLWEEISSSMKKLGYNRNAKRCKEKWENINKYFKKVKESNKRRPEDSKTCPYFHQLDAIYKERSKHEITQPSFINPSSSTNLPPENLMVPLMVQPEQQWPLQPVQQRQQIAAMGDHDSDNNGEDDDDDEDDEDDDDEDEAGGYEIVTNKPPSSSVGTVE
ncbi:trihelix transcription factor DF1 [Impatiens glandulifera]|uniref:trihelix transcription factor DF1 n=1 Tax=Impatiens glandulifera TaxID=253017 RepID=UPI001FB175A3|nr:trihelix transcription factor DF1 [Impatiens glandulifera]